MSASVSNATAPDAGDAAPIAAASADGRNDTRAALALEREAEFLADEMQSARIGTWRLLGRLFARAPDAGLLATLAELEPTDPEAGPVPMGWELLRRAAIRARTGPPEALEDEYFALYVGVGRGELVPYGSWYLTGFLMEKPVALLRADLARLGLEREAGTVESEDHVAALSESLSHVIAASDEIDLATQRAFFMDHVEPWMGRFFDDVQNASNADFYRAAACLGKAVVDFERELFAMRA